MLRKIKTVFHGAKNLLYQFAQPNSSPTLFDRLERCFGEIENLKSMVAHLDDSVADLSNRQVGKLIKMHYDALSDDVMKGHLSLATNNPVAIESYDHIAPRGTKNDNSVWYAFNHKLVELVQKEYMAVLDMGCAGGGFVESLVEDGHDAYGIEGSNYSLIHKRASWRTMPERLFTCDITKPFAFHDQDTGQPFQFDVITGWELMEHIKSDELDTVFRNIYKHLVDGGYFICSIATFDDIDPETNINYHQTVQNMEWWVEKFEKAGFINLEDHLFIKQDWLRGGGNQGVIDWSEDKGLGFHLVLKKFTGLS